MDLLNRPARILIVDDNPKNLQVLGGALRSNKYDVEFSTSGEGAIKWLKDEDFDLVLLDIMMPEMDGYETCKQIRKLKENIDIPIIFLTAKTDRESILKGFKIGAQDYITKPFDSLELIARVNTHVELSLSRKKLSDINEYLEKVVEERTRLLIEANKEISTLDSAKSEFLNMISHEIRTPLNGIKGAMQLLKLKIENEDLDQLMYMLDSSVIRLEDFSLTAIQITRLRSGKYKLENVGLNIGSEIDLYLDRYRDIIDEKEVEIKMDKGLAEEVIETDIELFKNAMISIIDNAIRFSPQNGEIKITFEKSGENISLYVVDRGNGFPEKILSSRIKPFNPGETFVNKNMGLNLYFVNLIMETLGGSMSISNKENHGAVVKLTFPLVSSQ